MFIPNRSPRPATATPTTTEKPPRTVLPAAAIALVLVSLAGGGCHRGVIYTGATLPPEFAAPEVRDPQAVLFPRIVGEGVRNDAIYFGDVLNVTIVTGAEEQSPEGLPLRVSDDGTVAVPLVGMVPVAGLSLVEAEEAIRQASIERGVYLHPVVSVLIQKRRSNRVTVLGEVKEPGVVELPAPGSDLPAAITAAGGFTDEADTIVEIHHPARLARRSMQPGERMTGAARGASVEPAGFRLGEDSLAGGASDRIDLAAVGLGDGKDLSLEDGAVVMVTKQDPRLIQVIGLVNEPDQFKVPANQEVRLLDAIAMAKGRRFQLADKVRVLRQVENRQEPVVIELSVKKAKRDARANVLLAAGDVVSVEETPVTFVLDMLQKFMRVGFTSYFP